MGKPLWSAGKSPRRSKTVTVAASGGRERKGVRGDIFIYMLYTLVRFEFSTTNIFYFCFVLIYFLKVQNQRSLGRREEKRGAVPKLPSPLCEKTDPLTMSAPGASAPRAGVQGRAGVAPPRGPESPAAGGPLSQVLAHRCSVTFPWPPPSLASP